MFQCVKELTHFDGALKIHKILMEIFITLGVSYEFQKLRRSRLIL